MSTPYSLLPRKASQSVSLYGPHGYRFVNRPAISKTVGNRKDKRLVSTRSRRIFLDCNPLSEYNSLKETLFLLSSDRNRTRLFEGIQQVNDGKTTTIKIDEL